LVEQLRDLVHTAVRSRVEFDVVNEPARIDVAAGLALAARLRGDGALAIRPDAIERLCKDARNRGFAHPARAGEHVGMVQALLRERIAQGLDHMALPHHGVEAARPVFARENRGRHLVIVGGAGTPHRITPPAQTQGRMDDKKGGRPPNVSFCYTLLKLLL